MGLHDKKYLKVRKRMLGKFLEAESNFHVLMNIQFLDIILLSVTWLYNAVYNSKLFPEEYLVLRKDRDLVNRGRKTGGGVFIVP